MKLTVVLYVSGPFWNVVDSCSSRRGAGCQGPLFLDMVAQLRFHQSRWTRFAQASSCIWRRLGRLPNLQALGNCLVPSGEASTALTSTSSRNQDNSVQRCNAFSSSILSGFVAPTNTAISRVSAFCPVG